MLTLLPPPPVPRAPRQPKPALPELTFGERVRKWRKGKRMTRAEAAELLGVKPRTLESWEQGLRSPAPFAQAALVQLHGM